MFPANSESSWRKLVTLAPDSPLGLTEHDQLHYGFLSVDGRIVQSDIQSRFRLQHGRRDDVGLVTERLFRVSLELERTQNVLLDEQSWTHPHDRLVERLQDLFQEVETILRRVTWSPDFDLDILRSQFVFFESDETLQLRVAKLGPQMPLI